MNTFGINSTRRNIKDDLKTAEQRRQGEQRRALQIRNRAKFTCPLNAGPFVYNSFPAARDVSSESDCRDAIAGDNIEAEMMETYTLPSILLWESSQVARRICLWPSLLKDSLVFLLTAMKWKLIKTKWTSIYLKLTGCKSILMKWKSI
ncbi:unnamed protein product [Cylindrotheca closterium]|uniref:Uncharacterized protein n=1 Tax=Cylindrotheca closterium TaxID=2856 RepID=A0AAD2JM97_9STRA|nr:unnamed protein product [Cylindrotheca closterium]